VDASQAMQNMGICIPFSRSTWAIISEQYACPIIRMLMQRQIIPSFL
jgi:hypothetical protein